MKIKGNFIVNFIKIITRLEVGGTWRRLHNCTMRSFIILNASPDIKVVKSKVARWAEPVARMAEIRNAYKILVGKPEGTDHSKDLSVDGRIILEQNSGGEGVDWDHLVQDSGQWWSLVQTIMNLRVPLKEENCLIS
jgi:hypothetical protein